MKDGPVLRGVLEFFFEQGSEGVHWAFQDERFIGKNADGTPIWSYEGLRFIESGDALRVIDADGRVLWTGVVALDRVRGAWRGWAIHAKPTNADLDAWGGWFKDGLRAELRPGKGE